MYIFNSKIEDAGKLEKSLVGRNQIVDQLEEMVLETANNGTLFQNLIIGPRGSGKTHILIVLYNRINGNKKIREKIEIAYMAEDEVGIGTFFDFLIRIFAAFARWNEDENKIEWLQQKIEELKLVNDSEREEKAKRILLKYLDGKDLIILIENLNTIFEGLKKTGQSKLRDFIQQYTNISFIATSQSLFNGVRNEDMPFHNFFNITHLKKLTLQETIELIIQLAKLENHDHDDLIDFVETSEGRGKIKAINEFTQGNHRLIVLFYDFLKTEFKSELSEPFLKTIDKLKPY
ncbi:MAG: ATP-binding protein, partial [Bacteroidales bacterium]|nr:ATP-binding protein [Bacteroidales bacterium]